MVDQQNQPVQSKEPIRVVTVRMPESLHERLKEATIRRGEISMNLFCVLAINIAIEAIASAEILKEIEIEIKL